MRPILSRLLLALLLVVPTTAAPQNADSANSQPSALLKPQELDALVAPIALYPDQLLSLVLMASTYPLEVVQADRWLADNGNLSQDQLKAAVDKQTWDDSIKSLAATPSVLSSLSSKLDWTRKLGDAVLAQQGDVMDAIQRLRLRARSNNKLESTKEQTVDVQQEGSRQIVSIAPAVADTVYVPQYDPNAVYGDWPYSDYPPYAFGGPGYYGGALLAGGIAFGAGYLVGRWASGRYNWGGGVNWGNRNIVTNLPANVNRTGNINNIGNSWQHNPAHRQGVGYNNAAVQQRFGTNNLGNQQRSQLRNNIGQSLGGANGNRTGLGNRPTATPSANARPAQGSRASTRQNAAQRGTTGANRAASRQSGARSGGAVGNNAQRGRAARAQTHRGHANVNRGGVHMGGARTGSMGGARTAGARSMGGARFAGGGFRGGGRRSDVALKHDIALVERLPNGLGLYRFQYYGNPDTYVGVIAQEVQEIRPDAVTRGADGYLRVLYGKLGVPFRSYEQWLSSHSPVR